MTATLLLERMWIHDAANLANNVALYVVDEGEQRTALVTTRGYASGRRRAVSAPGRPRAVSLGLHSVPRATYDLLCDLQAEGRLLLVRMPRGRKLWGTIATVQAVEYRRADRLESVTMTVDEVTFDEAV